MAKDIDDLQKLMNKAIKTIPDKLGRIIEVEGLNFISENFQDEGFHTGSGLNKWEKRKTTRDGRDITRYRTNRVGTKGELNQYGQSIQGRSIMTGHNTGGNKLRNSFEASRSQKKVVFRTPKDYAQRHNEGLEGMPQRQFMGKSEYLNENIKKKLTKELDKLFK